MRSQRLLPTINPAVRSLLNLLPPEKLLEAMAVAFMGKSFKECRENALRFIEGFPKGHPQGIVGQFLKDMGYRNIMVGRDFVKASPPRKWGIFPRKRIMIPLCKEAIAFHDTGWLHPQVWGQHPPLRPNYIVNKARWDMAIFSSREYVAKMKRSHNVPPSSR